MKIQVNLRVYNIWVIRELEKILKRMPNLTNHSNAHMSTQEHMGVHTCIHVCHVVCTYAADETKPRGRRFHTVSCQKYFWIYQFKDLITNRGV